MEAFDCAIRMERDTKAFYESLAAMSTTPDMKNLFTLLAQAEQEHHDALVQLKRHIAPQEQTECGDLDPAACVFKPLLAKRDLVALLKKDPGAYRLVIAKEEKGVELYTELAARTRDASARVLLLRIAAEASKHLSITQNIYSFVDTPKTFLASGEFSNLKEY
ncbi:ferritin-like domain-containing protein [Geomesophilobacter sediminis]|uniref:Ferritin family protein n=1 Tax=Geomesophilobacter sediminis TaxID=2798584 RepID=A0A8J7IR17_9BACT|nr:ferritin family protein [Geomesophilobacter sediminis]MBJ6725224.1 ferritin family protein [Geomesophilobacter sediminis]